MTVSDYIKNFDVLLFDMGKTFMFEGDRFDEEQNYELTYKSFGGSTFINSELHEIINYIYGVLLARSRNAKYLDDMINVDELIESDDFFRNYKKEDRVLIERVFAYHECGIVPESCVKVLDILSRSHQLGVISNIWCKSDYFRGQLKKDGVYDLFGLVVFSSDYRFVKPSRKLFDAAISHFKRLPSEIVFIGDNYKRDIVGSKNAGMNSILVNNSISSKITGEIQPNYIISHIEELVSEFPLAQE